MAPARTGHLLATGVAALLLSCRPTPDLHPETLLPWLTCHECVDGELDAVLSLDTEAVPGLVRALQGPSDDVIAAATSQFTDDWNRTARYLAGEGRRPPVSRPDFVARNLSNFTAMYRTRAAFALGELGGSEARRALEDLIRSGGNTPALRTEVRNAVQGAIGRIDGRS